MRVALCAIVLMLPQLFCVDRGARVECAYLAYRGQSCDAALVARAVIVAHADSV